MQNSKINPEHLSPVGGERVVQKGGQLVGYFYILGSILLTVYGQLVVKWKVSEAGAFPPELSDKLKFLVTLQLNPWVLSGLFGAVLASWCWMAAMTKFELSFAYPFMSASFVLVSICSVLFFHETLNAYRIVGLSLIVLGIVVSSQG